jgi:hypothetical protein
VTSAPLTPPAMHIIFGWRDPSRKVHQLRKKGDLYYSESNYNLMIESDHAPTLGDFIEAFSRGKPIEQPERPVWLMENDFVGLCSDCYDSNVLCPLIQRPGTQPPPDASSKEVAEALGWPWDSRERFRACPILNGLLDMTETEAERRFYEMYFLYQIVPMAGWLLEAAYRPDFSEGLRKAGRKRDIEIGGSGWAYAIWQNFIRVLDWPALVPQVLLNFVPTKDLPDDHPDKDFFESNEGRVDFFFLDDRGKHLVQIDGPYHHSSAAEYTKVLRRDRTMRRQGYMVHRFSNMEVLRAEHFKPFEWELFS